MGLLTKRMTIFIKKIAMISKNFYKHSTTIDNSYHRDQLLKFINGMITELNFKT